MPPANKQIPSSKINMINMRDIYYSILCIIKCILEHIIVYIQYISLCDTFYIKDSPLLTGFTLECLKNIIW